MKTAVKRSTGEFVRLAAGHYLVMAIYHAIRITYRVAYGFRLIGTENVPKDGPAIILPSDSQGLGGVLAQGLANIGLLERFFSREGVVCFMHEQLVATVFSRIPMRMRTYGLRPHGSGTMALSLIDAYRELGRKGIAIIAPEGDTCFDGKTVSVRDGCAWLGLRTAAPLVSLIPTAGCYDIWPFWQAKPKLTGRMSLIVGEPFRVTETPLAVVSEQDLARARQIIQVHVDALRFGPDGIAGWQGQAEQRGQTVDSVPPVRLSVPEPNWQPPQTGIKRKGMAILLFQCPVCGANDSIVQRKRLFGADQLACRACGAAWSAQRRPGRDYWLTLVSGPEEIMGLAMSLSQWYSGMKQGLCVEPLKETAIAPCPEGEQAFLCAENVTLVAHDAAGASAAAGEGPAVATRSDEHLALPTKNVVGAGRLLLTAQRLQWTGEDSILDFDLDRLRAVHLTFRNVLTVAHGAAWYTFNLGDESAIKWVAYLDRILDRVTVAGHPKATISPY